MDAPGTRSASHYRRRILAIGALFTFGLFVIGAPIFNNRIEDDLEQRVPDELAELGFTGVSARFSGQDGTLACRAPLDDPEGAVQAAYDVWGVRAIELDRSCRVNSAPLVTTPATAPPPSTSAPSEAAGDTTSASTVPATTTPPPDFATVADIVATDPQFALLAVLVEESGLASQLTSGGPITMFAPNDAAFDEIAADVIAELRTDPDLLARVLSHHVVAGRFGAGDLVTGTLESIAGDQLTITVDGAAITVDGAVVVDADLVAGNGVVHVVDALLEPADVDLSAFLPMAEVAVAFADGVISLDGVVASEVERAVLVAAAGDIEIVDRLDVDPDLGLDEPTASELARLVTAMRAQLVNGVARFDGTSLSVSGSYLGDAERDAMLTVADEVGAEAALEPRPDATDDDAVDLEAELNAFVAANPILFEPSSSVLSPSAAAVIDRVALEAQQFSGVTITVEGHTDSDGDPTDNLVLSQLRALAVRDALVERGIDPGSIAAEGFGSNRPILVDGVEDKAASRRVEFRVVATP